MKFATLNGKVVTEELEKDGITEYNFIQIETSIYKHTTQEQLDTCDHDPDENNRCKSMVGARHQVQLDFVEDIYGRRLYRCRRGYQLAGKPHRIRGGKTYRQSHYRT